MKSCCVRNDDIMLACDELNETSLSFRGGSTLGQGACAPDSLVAPQIQKLIVRSDVISEVPKCSKIQIFLGELMGRGLAAPFQEPHPLSAFQASFLQVSGSNPLQSWQPY